jgi:hypothetical protein
MNSVANSLGIGGKYENVRILAEKAESVGGVMVIILGYGVRVDDLPDDTPPYIKEAWQRVWNVTNDVIVLDEWISETLDSAVNDARNT